MKSDLATHNSNVKRMAFTSAVLEFETPRHLENKYITLEAESRRTPPILETPGFLRENLSVFHLKTLAGGGAQP